MRIELKWRHGWGCCDVRIYGADLALLLAAEIMPSTAWGRVEIDAERNKKIGMQLVWENNELNAG